MEHEAGKIVVDTDVLVDFLRGKKLAVEELGKLVDSRVALATTVVNVFELSWGGYRLGRIREIEDLVEVLTILNLTVREAVKAGEEMAYLSSIGQPVEIRDLLIGVIARENGYAILTGNTKHFKRIRGLRVIPYKHE